jgi:hypothetical protein
MENEMLSMKEIMENYKDKWVLIEYEELDENLNVRRGKVIANSSSKDEIYARLAETKGKDVAIEYTGKLPEDLVVMF